LPAEGRPPEPSEADPPAADSPAKLPEEIPLRDFLAIAPVGKYGRTPFHQDWIEAKLVEGDWKPPRAGDALTAIDGVTRLWEKATAGDDGWLTHNALRGGYALAAIDSPAPRVMILEARGHSAAYVNGEPRAGDPYNTGWLRLPVLLQKGENEFLFHVGRGRVQAKLVAPRSPVMLDTADSTLPELIEGESEPLWGALLLINASAQPLDDLALLCARDGVDTLRTQLASVPPLSVRKVGFQMTGGVSGETASAEVHLRLVQKQGSAAKTLDELKLSIAVKKPTERHIRTFLSDVDDSVQYYAVQPASDPGAQGIILSLHGAAVKATRQAGAYSSKPWAHVVAPTNRRPFGFDWEDWGRLDALEVLGLAQERLGADPRRTWLTGHSMGGHGTWHLGATYPDRFAAIGPSAGWFSFWAYGGMPKFDTSRPIEALLVRGSNVSDTLKLKRNLVSQGVYLLHGDQDDNVPVAQARFMRQQLGTFHPDFAYYEQPGAKHWWGNKCCDWPPMMQFLERHSLPEPNDVRQVDFTTASPGVSSQSNWLEIAAQQKQLDVSQATIDLDADKRRFTGSTKNVARMAFDVAHLPANKTLHVELDGQEIENIAWPGGDGKLWLERNNDKWRVTGKPSPALKGPHRYGGFKDVFRHHVVLVYGTRGNPEENAWSLAKARFDAETFWYRGNGSLEVVSDREFDAKKEPNRNVVIYGNADTNGAWPALLSTCPVQIRRGSVRIEARPESGLDVACLMVRPREGSDTAMVGVVAGTGPVGMRATDRLRYFVSGVAYPDFVLFGSKFLTEGTSELRALGYFGLDWSLENGEIEWRDLAL
jgi:pimeloyl-ACP methyl ester carboxylesterase